MWNKFKTAFFLEENVASRRKIFNSLWAIFFGLIISSIFILILKSNPIAVFNWIVVNSFNSPVVKNQTILTVSVFIFAAIAVGIAFKSGMFNIGVPGQMMISGILSIIIIVSLSEKGDLSNPTNINSGVLILAFIVGSIVAALTGALAGVLKAYLKINEVITTILLNWIIYYICYYFLRSENSIFSNEITPLKNSKSIELSKFYSTPEFAVIVLLLAIIFAFGIWFVIKRTTLGYKIKSNGLNKDASKYSGTNEKIMTISILSFSGFVSGIAGFIWFILLKKIMILGTSPLLEGFDSIAISLLAYNSPLGIIATSTFYSILSIGSKTLQSVGSRLDSTTVQIIVGIIIYLAAISTVFNKFKLISKFTNFIHYIRYKRFYFSKDTKFFKENKKWYKEEILKLKKDHKLKSVLFLEKELLLIKQKIDKISKADIAIFRSYYWIKFLEYKKYFKSRKILKLKNSSNKIKWKSLKQELKNNFFNESMAKDKDPLEVFKEISNKKREINKQLIELGYFDQKVLKEQFNANKINNKNHYNNQKSNIIKSFLEKRKEIRKVVK